MRVRWSAKAITELESTLDFWSQKNKSDAYSEKIAIEAENVQRELEEKPLFFGKIYRGRRYLPKSIFQRKICALLSN